MNNRRTFKFGVAAGNCPLETWERLQRNNVKEFFSMSRLCVAIVEVDENMNALRFWDFVAREWIHTTDLRGSNG